MGAYASSHQDTDYTGVGVGRSYALGSNIEGRAFSSSLVIALGAGDIFRTSNDGHRLLPLLPQPTILHAQHQQCLTRCFGRLARRSRLLTNHAPHAVASFHSLHARGPTVLAPFQCRRPPVHLASQVLGEAESLTSLPSAGLPSALS